MATLVQLPNDALIEYWSFCRAIARAIRPADENGLEGIDCIVGTLFDINSVVDKSQLPVEMQARIVQASNEHHTLQHLVQNSSTASEQGALSSPPEKPQKIVSKESWLPLVLTERDRQELEKMLPHLPPLRYPISDKDAAEFLVAYIKHSKRADRIPNLVSPSDVARWQEEQDKIFDCHQKALRDDLSGGLLLAVDKRNVRVNYLIGGMYIPRKYAIEYLERYGIAYGSSDIQNHLANKQSATMHTDADADADILAESADNQYSSSTPTATSTSQAITASPDSQHADQSRSTASENRKFPVGVSTPDIANAFHGLGKWTYRKWSKNIKDGDWAQGAVLKAGRPGKGGATLWNPVELALLAQERLGILDGEYTRAFKANKCLRRWQMEWDEYLSKKRHYAD